MAATIQKILKPTKYRAVDTSGNNNHGQIYSGRGLEFDGVGDHLTTTYGSGLNPYTTPITVACWVKLGDYTGSGDTWFGPTNGSGQRFYLGFNSNKFDMGIQDSQWTFSVDSGALPPINKHTWYRVVVVAKDGVATMYVNGESQFTKNYTSYTFNSNFYIGWHGSNTSLKWTGCLSDFQFWESAWTQSDITFDYLNPESLALNNGGTLLTESNLKLWYPMQDGHRGQQSYIMDGANTGLSSVSYYGGSTVAFASWTDGSGSGEWSVTNGIVTATNTGNLFYNNSATALVDGVTYKATIVVDSYTKGSVKAYAGGSQVNFGVTTAGTYSVYITNATSNNFAGLNGAAFSAIISSVEFYPINDKHHATTVFEGDNLITAANAVKLASDGSTADETDATTGWTNTTTSVFSTSGTYAHTGSKSIKFSPSGNGGRITTDLNDYLTVGRTYKVSIFARHGGSGDGAYIRLASNEGLTSDTTDLVGGGVMYNTVTTFTEYTATFVHSANTRYFGVKETGSNHNGTYYIDSFYVKEVGVASGWTNADQQLDIPQTALQSYNQLAWFQDHLGENQPHASASHHNDFNPEAGDFTVSAWVMQSDTLDDNYFFAKGGGGDSGWHCRVEADGSIQFTIEQNEGGNEGNVDGSGTFSNNINEAKFDVDDYLGEWWHFIGVINRSTDLTYVYINGELVGTLDISGVDEPIEHSTGVLKLGSWTATYAGGTMNGSATEFSVWKGVAFSQSDVNELYNDGKALDALTHTQKDYLKGYWRNNGLATWQDLTTNDRDVTLVNGRETILLPAGVDASRDTQGFIMNSQKDTNSLNLTSFAEDDPSTFITEHDHVKCINFHPSNNYDVFSICGWVKAKHISENGFLIDNRYDADTGWVVFANDTSGNFKFKIGDGTDAVTIDSGADLTLDTWHHLAVTYSGNAGTIKMYFDGVCKIVNGTATNVAVLTSLSNLENIQTVIGGRSFGDVENGFHGQIDDVLYYNKVLSDGGVSDEATAKGEIARIYNAGKRSHR